jgi:hypothetical protein
MVRRAKGTLPDNALPRREQSGHAVNLGHLKGFFKRKRRQHRAHALGQHGLAAARRPQEQQVMPARGRNFHGPLGMFLPFDVRKIP